MQRLNYMKINNIKLKYRQNASVQESVCGGEAIEGERRHMTTEGDACCQCSPLSRLVP